MPVLTSSPLLNVEIPSESTCFTSSYVAIPVTDRLVTVRFVPVQSSANVAASPPPTAVLAIPTHFDVDEL